MDETALRDYANHFWEELTLALWADHDSFLYLPIVFSNNRGNEKSSVYGVTYSYTNHKTGIATIFPVVFLDKKRSDEEIQATIRHELIHYLLAIQYQCYSDSSALFWLISDLFNGNAYLPMNANSFSIYGISKPYISAIYKLFLSSKMNSVAINISLMLTAIDDIEASNSPDFSGLDKKLSLCLDAAKIAVQKA